MKSLILKKTIVVILFCLYLILPSCAANKRDVGTYSMTSNVGDINPEHACQFSTVRRIALLPFENEARQKNAEKVFKALFRTSMLNQSIFEKIEVPNLKTMFRMINLKDIITNNELALKVGDAMRYEAIVLGQINEYVRGDEKGEPTKISVKASLIDTRSKDVLWSGSISGAAAGVNHVVVLKEISDRLAKSMAKGIIKMRAKEAATLSEDDKTLYAFDEARVGESKIKVKTNKKGRFSIESYIIPFDKRRNAGKYTSISKALVIGLDNYSNNKDAGDKLSNYLNRFIIDQDIFDETEEPEKVKEEIMKIVRIKRDGWIEFIDRDAIIWIGDKLKGEAVLVGQINEYLVNAQGKTSYINVSISMCSTMSGDTLWTANASAESSGYDHASVEKELFNMIAESLAESIRIMREKEIDE